MALPCWQRTANGTRAKTPKKFNLPQAGLTYTTAAAEPVGVVGAGLHDIAFPRMNAASSDLLTKTALPRW